MSAKMYNVVVNVGDTSKGNQGYITYHKISSLEKFKLFLNGKYSEWVFATIYDYETKDKIEVIKR